jgi:hypothetical protein
MKRILTFLLLLTSMVTSAFTITYVPKDATHPYGAVVVKSDKQTNIWIEMLPGIGERGSGSATDLRKIAYWGGFNSSTSPESFFKAADYFGFNIILVQTANNYERGEIRYGYEYAMSQGADINQIHLAGNSLGGYGIAQVVHMDAELPKLFATISIFVMGPGTATNTAKHLAESQRPIWFFSSADDTKSGTNVSVTDKLYEAVKELGGQVWYTRYLTKGHSAFTAVAGAWGTARGQAGGWIVATAGSATELNNPAVTWYQWMFNNRLNGPVKSPLDPFVPYMPPVDPIDPIPKKPVFILYEDGTWEAVKE